MGLIENLLDAGVTSLTSGSAKRAPDILNVGAVFIDGAGFLGTTSKVTLPKIEFESIEHKNGFSSGNHSTSILKELKATIALDEINPVYARTLKKRGINKSKIYLKGAIATNEGEKKMVATFLCNVDSFSIGDLESAKTIQSTLELNVKAYKLEFGGVVVCDIDVDNFICEIDGKDIWEETRNIVV